MYFYVNISRSQTKPSKAHHIEVRLFIASCKVREESRSEILPELTIEKITL